VNISLFRSSAFETGLISQQIFCCWVMISEAETTVNREQKKELISSLNALLLQQAQLTITLNKGLTVAEVQELRKRIRAAGAGYKVAKNRLARLALAGTKFEGISDLLRGPTGIAYSKDAVAAAKVIAKFAKENNKLVVVGGSLDGQTLDASGVEALATLPGLDELRGKLIGLIQAPATKIAGVLAAPGGQIARVLSARAKQGEAA
jgi:large subunit ribosomal protein L10